MPNLFDNVAEKAQQGFEKTRDAIHDVTAEKSVADKVKEEVPGNAKDAGTQVGEKIDEGYDKAKEMTKDLK
jgi:hypothetical protein